MYENFLMIHVSYSSIFRAGECSRSCGGGIQPLTRDCINPIPKNGGKYCIGKHKMYSACNYQECPDDDLDFREEQCQNLNNRTHKWTAKYWQSQRDECKLYCINEKTQSCSMLKEKVRYRIIINTVH